MPASRTVLLAAACAVAVALPTAAGTAPQDAPAVEPPRYRFVAGQELRFETTCEPASRGSGSTRVVVVRRNADGSWHLVATTTWRPEGETEPRVTWQAADLHEDGRIDNPSATNEPGLDALFPRLPATAAEQRDGWQASGPGVETTTSFRVVPHANAPAGVIVIAAKHEDLTDFMVAGKQRSSYAWSRATGVVVAAETHTSEGAVWPRRTTSTTRLAGSRRLDAADLARFARETDAAFAAVAAYRDAVRTAAQAPAVAAAAELLAGAEAGLRAARERLELPEVVAWVDGVLGEHETEARYARAAAAQAARLVGKTLPDFEAAALDGTVHSAVKHRGKVLVLHFWYRECGWCVRSMPQLRRLAETFAGRDVVVLGVNTDEHAGSLRFVVENAKPGYPMLHAPTLAAALGVEGYPTFAVVDGEGVIRAWRRGWSPTLHDELAHEVEALLAPAAANATPK